MGWRRRIDGAVAVTLAAGQWLALPVALLLFLQWPLRDIVHAYSRDANDLAQWLFALYVSLAMTFATRQRAHLATDAFSRRLAPAIRRRIARYGALFCVAPWSAFVLIVIGPAVWQSWRDLEGFPDTYNPGYFVLKTAALLLALLALVQAVLDATDPSQAR